MQCSSLSSDAGLQGASCCRCESNTAGCSSTAMGSCCSHVGPGGGLYNMPAKDEKQARASGCSVGCSILQACCTLRATSTAQSIGDASCAGAAGGGAADSAAAAAAATPAAASCHAVSSAPDSGMVSCKSTGIARCAACCLEPAAAASTMLSVGAAQAAAAAASLGPLLFWRAAYAADRLISCAHDKRVLLQSAACTAGDLSTAQRACTQALVYLGLVVLGKD